MKFSRKERREARKLERRIAKRLKRQQTPGVTFKTDFRTVTEVLVTPAGVTIKGTDQNGSHVSETQDTPDPHSITKYRLTTGESP